MSSPPAPLLLASASPRRHELLRRAGVAFEVSPADVDERALAGEEPESYAARIAREKALAIAGRAGSESRFVLGADTVVVVGDRIYGKPVDAEDAIRILRELRGLTHRVLTAVALARSDGAFLRELRVESRVTLREASDPEIRAYVATGEPLDKAGAYALQGEGARFVLRVEGSRSNVIGLPLDETLALLRDQGLAQ
ncbi:MAG TPA: Maf family protein [Myxococcota bacterium]|nr:Maf family protein [Myxococcota bacterium]